MVAKIENSTLTFQGPINSQFHCSNDMHAHDRHMHSSIHLLLVKTRLELKSDLRMCSLVQSNGRRIWCDEWI